jgi:hypothetical protein
MLTIKKIEISKFSTRLIKHRIIVEKKMNRSFLVYVGAIFLVIST